MSRLFFLPVSLVAAFAAAVIASPVAAVADEAEVQNNSAGAESASSPDSVQVSEEPTPGWNQADTCEWRIDDGALILLTSLLKERLRFLAMAILAGAVQVVCCSLLARTSNLSTSADCALRTTI